MRRLRNLYPPAAGARRVATPAPGGADLDWAERYRPKSLKDMVGNGPALASLKKWAASWEDGAIPKVHAVVLQGTPGVGKTSAAHALAQDMGWDVIELNASDARSAPTILRVAGTGSVSTTFASDGSFRPASDGGRTLIILDEADNLYERGGSAATSGGNDMSDRGGKRAIIQTIRQSRQPIILIVNDYYSLTKGSGAALRTLAEPIKFQRPQARSVAKRLAEICKAEGVKAQPDALIRLAEEAGGDLRAAVNDLQAAAQGHDLIRVEDVRGLGNRDTGRSVFDAMPDIFKTMDIEVARNATRDLDENPEHIILWVDENLPLEYKEPGDLSRGYAALSKADVYLGRVRRRQYYGLWSYASQMMTAGVAMAKKQPYKGWTRWQFPGWLRRMSSSKAQRGLRDGVARKIAAHTHTSMREARGESMEPMSMLFQADDEFAIALGADMNLGADELAFLLNTKPTTKKVKALMDEIGAELERRPRQSAGFWADDEEEGAPTKTTVGGTKAKASGSAEAKAAGSTKPAGKAGTKPAGKAGTKPAEAAVAKGKADAKARAKPKSADADDADNGDDDADARPTPKEGQKGLFEF